MSLLDGISQSDQDAFGELVHELVRESMKIHGFFQHGVSQSMSGEMAVMRSLMDKPDGITPTELGRRAGLSAARTSNVLKSLEQKDWIVRTSAQHGDRRKTLVYLSEHGKNLAEEKKRTHHEMAVFFLSKLGKEDSQEVLRLICRTREILESDDFKEAMKLHEVSHREG